MSKVVRVSDEFYSLLLEFERRYKLKDHVDATRRLVPIIHRCLNRLDDIRKPKILKRLEALL